jgi:hypothetical protein
VAILHPFSTNLLQPCITQVQQSLYNSNQQQLLFKDHVDGALEFALVLKTAEFVSQGGEGLLYVLISVYVGSEDFWL